MKMYVCLIATLACVVGCTKESPAATQADSPVVSTPAAPPAPPAPPGAPELEPQWALSLGSPSLDRADCVAMDERGFSYLAFVLDAIPRTPKGDRGIMTLHVAAFDPAGVEQWRQGFQSSGDLWAESLDVNSDGSIDVLLHTLGDFRVGKQVFKKNSVAKHVWVRLAAGGAVQRAEEIGETGALATAENGDLFVARTDVAKKSFVVTRRDLEGAERWTTELLIESGETIFSGLDYVVFGGGMLVVSGTVIGELVVGEQRAGELHQTGAWLARLDPDTGKVAWVRVLFMADAIRSPQVALLESGDMLAVTQFPRDEDTLIRQGDELLPRARGGGYDISRLSPEGDTRWRQTFGHDTLGFEHFNIDWGLMSPHALGDRAVLLASAGVTFAPDDPRTAQLGVDAVYLGWLDEDGKLLRSDLFGSPKDDGAGALAISGGRLLLAGRFAGPMRIGETTLEPVPRPSGHTLMSVFLASFALQPDTPD